MSTINEKSVVFFFEGEKRYSADLTVIDGIVTLDNVVAVEGETSAAFHDSKAAAVVAYFTEKASKENDATRRNHAATMASVTGEDRLAAMRDSARQDFVRYELTENTDGTFKAERKTSVKRVPIIPVAAKVGKNGNVIKPEINYGFNLTVFELLKVTSLYAHGFAGKKAIVEAMHKFYTDNNLPDLYNLTREGAVKLWAKQITKYRASKNNDVEADPSEEIVYRMFCEESVYTDRVNTFNKKAEEMKKSVA